MEQVLIEEEAKKEAEKKEMKKEEKASQKKTAKALKEVLKEIKKAVKKAKDKEKSSVSPIDKKVKEEAPKKNDARQYGINPEEIQQLDYAKLFGYLDSLKVNQYQYNSKGYGSEGNDLDSSDKLKEQTMDFIKEMKMDKIKGHNRDYEISKRSEAYFWFKLVHGKGITELLYDLSFT